MPNNHAVENMEIIKAFLKQIKQTDPIAQGILAQMLSTYSSIQSTEGTDQETLQNQFVAIINNIIEEKYETAMELLNRLKGNRVSGQMEGSLVNDKSEEEIPSGTSNLYDNFRNEKDLLQQQQLSELDGGALMSADVTDVDKSNHKNALINVHHVHINTSHNSYHNSNSNQENDVAQPELLQSEEDCYEDRKNEGELQEGNWQSTAIQYLQDLESISLVTQPTIPTAVLNILREKLQFYILNQVIAHPLAASLTNEGLAFLTEQVLSDTIDNTTTWYSNILLSDPDMTKVLETGLNNDKEANLVLERSFKMLFELISGMQIRSFISRHFI